MLTEKTFDTWVESLESGQYRQGRSQLRSPGYSYCCMGVLCEVLGVDLDAEFTADYADGQLGCPVSALGGVVDDDAPIELREALSHATRSRLAGMNDYLGLSFAQIAAWLREHRDEIVTSV